jgi:calcineurin-like phosphoesterase family protein
LTNIWFTSDQHWGHGNILKFKDDKGTHFRGDLFKSVEEMDEHMIERWNSVVKEGDKVYQLGDIAFSAEHFAKIRPRLNGSIRWVPGNHDPVMEMLRGGWFKKVYGVWRIFSEEGLVMTHVPIRRDNFPTHRKVKVNVHGHIHQNMVKTDGLPDPFYYNVCVEVTGYTPVHMDILRDYASKL